MDVEEGGFGQQGLDSFESQSSSHGDDGSYRPTQQTQTQVDIDTSFEPTQTQDQTEDKSAEADKSGTQPPDEDSYHPSQSQSQSQSQEHENSSTSNSLGTVISATPPSQPILPPPPPPPPPAPAAKPNTNGKVLKPIPYVSPSKFTPHLNLPPPASQISEFTPSPEKLLPGSNSVRSVVLSSSQEDEEIAKRGAALAEQLQKDKEREREKGRPPKVTLEEILRRNVKPAAPDPERTEEDVVMDEFINWDAAEPASAHHDSIENGVLGSHEQHEDEVEKLREQLQDAHAQLEVLREENAARAAQLSAVKSASLPLPPPTPIDEHPPAPPPAPDTDALLAAVAASDPLLAASMTSTSADTALQKQLADAYQEKSELASTLAQRDRTIASLRAEVDTLTLLCRDASHEAARLKGENSELKEEAAIARSQATHGVAQACLLNEGLQAELDLVKKENELLREQARLTGDFVRGRAGEADRLERKVEELEDTLQGARRQVDDIGIRVYRSAA
ncbi:hypothetical protein EXIGLDRAFT_309769 [Exidia glandulosa HHB12029]|uniref:Uncharacterized protein n=1 Tax=Exidia glandulosa HHB12029 TaxID=1314781 RepID=A0A165D083_EXIGL|nr:hypothetical protein EXIGLDRAFT_309769 [Exidia glandulosa HHB12029]